MITLAIINFALSVVNTLITTFLSDLIEPLTDLATFVSAFQVPQTILDIYALVVYFLPIGTIGILFGFTVIIIFAKFVIACAHFLPSIIFGS